MGIYVFDAEYLYEQLARDAADRDSVHDFGRNLVPAAVAQGVAWAQHFEDACVRTEDDEAPYWRDVGTIDAYWEANIDLTATKPLLNLYDRRWPIWTYQEQLPSAKFVHNQDDRRGMAIESLVSGGCIISGSLFRSLLFSNVRVHSWSKVNWSVLLPGVQVGRRAHLTKVIVDRGCHIPDDMVIGVDPDLDARRFRRTSGGVTLVTQAMLDKLA
jgi:glucose-1-phosphate adenylyltransferase